MFFKKKKFFKLGQEDIGEDELKSWKMLSINNAELGDLVVRLRTSKPPISDVDKYNSAVEIVWDYSNESKGMPPEDNGTYFGAFEEAIDDLCWYNNLSFNVRISTGLGKRVWVFYTKSSDEFMEVMNSRLETLPRFPLSISFYEDPEWGLWRESMDDYVE